MSTTVPTHQLPSQEDVLSRKDRFKEAIPLEVPFFLWVCGEKCQEPQQPSCDHEAQKLSKRAKRTEMEKDSTGS